MKKILFLILTFFILTNFVNAQWPITQNLGSDSTLISVGRNFGGGIKGSLINKSYTDTTAANLSHADFYAGAQIFTTSDTSFWIRNKTATNTYWFKIGGAGGGATGSFWGLTGNYIAVTPANLGIGTNDPFNDLPFKTNNTVRLRLPLNGLERQSGGAWKPMLFDTTNLIWGYGDGGGTNWSLTGNSGTVAGTNFLGTTDSVDFVFKTNNAERIRLLAAGIPSSTSSNDSVLVRKADLSIGVIAKRALVATLQEVFDTESGGSILTKTDTIIYSGGGDGTALRYYWDRGSEGKYQTEYSHSNITYRHFGDYTAGCTSCGLNSIGLTGAIQNAAYPGGVDTSLGGFGWHNGPIDKHFFLADLTDTYDGPGIPANRYVTVEKNGSDFFSWYNLPQANSPITISGGTYPAYTFFNTSHDTLARYGFGVSTKNFFVLDTSFFNTAVGVGTRYPMKLLDVRGDILVNGITIGRGGGDIDGNIVIGKNIMPTYTHGNITAIGTNIGVGDEMKSYSTSIGYESSYYGNGWQSVAIGYRSLYNFQSTDAYSSDGITAVGGMSGYSMTSGINNTLYGFGSGHSITTGNNNTYIGINANGQGIFGLGTAGNTGSHNIGVGYNSQFYSVAGSGNISLGSSSLAHSAYSGSYNIAVGYNSGNVITTGSYNTVIGGYSGTAIATKSRWMALADGEGNVKIWADSVGNVGIGTSTPDSLLTVEQGIRGKRGVMFDGLPTFADTTNYKPVVINSSGTLYKATYWPGGGGGGGTPAGNFGNLQINRNGAFVTPASDSLDFESATGLSIIGNLSVSAQSTTPILYGSSVSNGDLSIKGTSDATKTTSYVTIQSDGGGVGIGTATPNEKLHIANGGLLVTGQANSFSPSTGSGAFFDFFSSKARFFGYNYVGGAYFDVSVNDILYAIGNSRVGIGQTSPTAHLHIKAGTTAANTAPLKFTSGSLMSTAEAGAVEEFLTDKFYGTITTGASRKEFTLNDIALTSGRIPYTTTNGRLTDLSTFVFDGTNVGIGTSTSSAKLHVISTTEQLRIGYDASNYYKTTVGSTGGVTFNAVGAGSAFTFSDNLDVTGVVSTDGLNADRTITAGGTTGNQTINKMAGTVNFAAAATTLTVTNSLVDANSIIFCVVRTNDATATIKNVVPGSGSFVITLTAAATAETSVGFIVTN